MDVDDGRILSWWVSLMRNMDERRSWYWIKNMAARFQITRDIPLGCGAGLKAGVSTLLRWIPIHGLALCAKKGPSV